MRILTIAALVASASVVPSAIRPQGAPPITAVTATGRKHAESAIHLAAAATSRPVKLDGVLDDEVWQRAAVAGGFTQSEPNTGQAASEKTEVRVAFDANFLYIGAHLFDREPTQLIINDIKKDFSEVDQDDFEVILDTYHDRRNGYLFITNAAGAKADRQVTGEGREVNGSWDAVWEVRTQIVADGWTVEMAIPLRALRFDPSASATWGVNFARRIRRKNEIDTWAPIPREYNVMRLSLAGDLDGVQAERAPRDVRLKPYVLGRSVRAVGIAPFTTTGDAGVDLKSALTRSLTLDVTVNPDFAQAEADEQTVNLTQFSTFFPEKREFFLENSGTFYVGDAIRTNIVSAPLTADEDLLLFHSRRVGLTAGGTPMTIPFGARLTGTAGGIGIGGLLMRTEREGTTPGSLYSALRLKRNLAPGSDIGAFAYGREGENAAAGQNHVAGVDANIRFGGKVDWNSYVVGSDAPGKSKGQYAWRTSFTYEAPFIHAKAAALEIGEGFQDDLGYYRRTAVRKYYLDAGLRPRPAWWQQHGVRELHPHVTWNYYDNLSGQTIGKNLHNGQTWFFADGAYTEVSANIKFDILADSLRLNRGDPTAQRVAPGGYNWTEWQWIYVTNASRPVSANLTAISGGLWSGRQNTLRATVTLKPTYHFRLSTGVQHSRIVLDRPNQKFSTTLWTGRANYSFTTKMFLDALTQYDAAIKQFNANVRFNVIHHPLSDLFIVFNEQRFITPDAPTPGRSLVVKFTQMLAF